MASPNHGPRRGGVQPSLVVIHTTCMPSFSASRGRLCDPQAQVSAHWLVDLDGRAEPLVDEALRAWHAGAGMWRGMDDINSHSIGIELQNTGDAPFPEPQMAALEGLLRDIMARWPVRPEGVIAHSDLAPDRKIDPGSRFDWRRLARQGLAWWPEGGVPEMTPAWLDSVGYPPVDDGLRRAAAVLRFGESQIG